MFINVLKKKRWYKELELSRVGDYNPEMIAIYEAPGALKSKTHVTYRYQINRQLPLKRYMKKRTDNLHGNQ